MEAVCHRNTMELVPQPYYNFIVMYFTVHTTHQYMWIIDLKFKKLFQEKCRLLVLLYKKLLK